MWKNENRERCNMELKYILGKIMQFIQIPQIHNCNIDKSSKIRFSSLVVGCNIEKNTYIAENSTVLYCNIGKFTSIASDCFIGGASHPTNWVSTSPVFQKGSSVLKQKYGNLSYEVYKRTIIGNDVWIGTHSLIKAGVKIGNGAVIGMGSVVTKDIGEYEIWGGNPARFIKYRFDKNIINELNKISWWDMSDIKIEKYAHLFDKPEVLLKEIKK